MDGEVQIYLAELDSCYDPAHDLTSLELERAQRFLTPGLRRRFMAARATLRRLIARKIGNSPREVDLVEGEHGKPMLGSGFDLRFNVSHSGVLALYGFTELGEIGVDIEQIRTVDTPSLAQLCFSDLERRELDSLPTRRRLTAFFDGWVRKEAVIKADGRGMYMPLDSFSVKLGGPAQFIEPPPGELLESWWLNSIDLGSGVRGAVALRASSPLEMPLVQTRPDKSCDVIVL